MNPQVRQALARKHGLNPTTATDGEVSAAVIAIAHAQKSVTHAAKATPHAHAARPVALPGPAPASSTKVHKHPETERLAYGTGHWKVQPNANGKPCVFTLDGWLDIETFETSGLTENNLKQAMMVTQHAPTIRDSFNKGPT